MLRSSLLLALPAAALLLAGCTASPEPPVDTAANDKEAVKFVACLTEEGQTAKIIDGGLVGMLTAEERDNTGGMSLNSNGGGGPTSFVSMTEDADGVWIASGDATGYPEDNGMQAAWAACAEKLPDFEQPEPDFSGGDGEKHVVSKEEAIEVGLAFAACARENGYADFEDPNTEGQISLSPDFTEDSLRALLEECSDTLDGIGFPVSFESAEQLEFDWMAVVAEFIDGPMGGSGPTSVNP